jgi:hypothetical protein
MRWAEHVAGKTRNSYILIGKLVGNILNGRHGGKKGGQY